MSRSPLFASIIVPKKGVLTDQALSSYRATALKICGCLLMDGKVCDVDEDD